MNYSRTNNTSSARNILNLTFKVDENIGIGSYDLLSIDENYEYLLSRYVGTSNVQMPLELDFQTLNIHGAGDIDLNGTVNILDAADLRRHLAQIITLSDYQLNFADAYYDAEINPNSPDDGSFYCSRSFGGFWVCCQASCNQHFFAFLLFQFKNPYAIIRT